MNKNTTIVGIIVAVLVIIAGYYAVHTNNMSKEMMDMEGMDMHDDMGMHSDMEMDMHDMSGMMNDTAATSSETQQVNEMGVRSGSTVTFDVTATNFSFSPTTLRVKKGDTVKIVLHDNGGVHDFVIDEFKVVTKRVNTGENDTVTFVADKAGSFEYYCSVGTHRQMGMKGTLIVE